MFDRKHFWISRIFVCFGLLWSFAWLRNAESACTEPAVVKKIDGECVYIYNKTVLRHANLFVQSRTKSEFLQCDIDSVKFFGGE